MGRHGKTQIFIGRQLYWLQATPPEYLTFLNPQSIEGRLQMIFFFKSGDFKWSMWLSSRFVHASYSQKGSPV